MKSYIHNYATALMMGGQMLYVWWSEHLPPNLLFMDQLHLCPQNVGTW